MITKKKAEQYIGKHIIVDITFNDNIYIKYKVHVHSVDYTHIIAHKFIVMTSGTGGVGGTFPLKSIRSIKKAIKPVTFK